MRLLWVSDSPTVPSGFGNVSRFVCQGLVQAGHDVHILGWGASGPTRDWNGATLHGVGWHPMGADVLLQHLYRLRPDLLLTLGDVWWLTFLAEPQVEQYFRLTTSRWLQYFPIDGHRPDGSLPPSWVEMLRRPDVPVAMSRYGQRVTRAAGVSCEYIPHGVDTHAFRPPADRDAAKRRMGYEGQFVVLSDARNQPRKMLPRLLTAFERFARGKSDVVLHLHCDSADPAARDDRYSYRIAADVEALGIGDRVRFTRNFTMKGGLTLEQLGAIYQAADAHLLVSTGEGFGLPTLQAASAGVVPLAPAYTANLELLADHGTPLPLTAFVTDEFGIARALVDVDATVDALEALYADREALYERSRRARAFAETYDWSCVLSMWQSLITRPVNGAVSSTRLGAPRRVETVSLGDAQHARIGDVLPSPLGATVRGTMSPVPDGVSITLKVLEQRAGALARQVLDDTVEARGAPELNIPVGCPVQVGMHGSTRKRMLGRVYVDAAAGEASARVVEALRSIFPVVHAWSAEPSLDDETRLTGLALAILTVDLERLDPLLPLWAAALGVPCIGAADNAWQQLIWPELGVNTNDTVAAVQLARDLLTDYATTSSLVSRARERFEDHAPAGLARRAAHVTTALASRGHAGSQAAAV